MKNFLSILAIFFSILISTNMLINGSQKEQDFTKVLEEIKTENDLSKIGLWLKDLCKKKKQNLETLLTNLIHTTYKHRDNENTREMIVKRILGSLKIEKIIIYDAKDKDHIDEIKNNLKGIKDEKNTPKLIIRASEDDEWIDNNELKKIKLNNNQKPKENKELKEILDILKKPWDKNYNYEEARKILFSSNKTTEELLNYADYYIVCEYEINYIKENSYNNFATKFVRTNTTLKENIELLRTTYIPLKPKVDIPPKTNNSFYNPITTSSIILAAAGIISLSFYKYNKNRIIGRSKKYFATKTPQKQLLPSSTHNTKRIPTKIAPNDSNLIPPQKTNWYTRLKNFLFSTLSKLKLKNEQATRKQRPLTVLRSPINKSK